MANISKKAITILLLLLYSNFSIAYTLIPQFQLGEYYSDSDWITQIMPSVQLKSETAKSELLMAYQLQLIEFRNESQLNRRFHQGSFQFDTHHDRIAIDVESQYTQDIVNPSNGITTSNIVGVERPDVLTTTAMPSISLPIGNFGDADVAWRYGQVNYYGSNIEATHDNREMINLKSGDLFQNFQWTWLSSNQESTQNNKRISHIRQSQLTTFFSMTSKTQSIASVGIEDNQGGQFDALQGAHWSVGLKWVPSRNSQLQAQVGHRPFGKTYVLNSFWKRKRSQWSATYDESVTTDAQARLNSFPKSIVPFYTNQSVQFFPQVTNQLFINRNFKMALEYYYKKSTFILDVFRDRREYINSPLSEKGSGYNLYWNYLIDSNLQSSLGYGCADQEFISGVKNPWSQEIFIVNWLIGSQLNFQFTAKHFSSKPNLLSAITENSLALNMVYKPKI